MRVFYYDFSDPAAYLLAEQMPQAEWVPVRAKAISSAVPSLDGIEEQIAAAACEMHPRAVLQAIERDTITKKLDAATELAQQRVDTVPSFWNPKS